MICNGEKVGRKSELTKGFSGASGDCFTEIPTKNTLGERNQISSCALSICRGPIFYIQEISLGQVFDLIRNINSTLILLW